MTSTLRVGLVQMKVGEDKQTNLKTALERIAECARSGAKIVSLPEMFNCPYHTSNFPVYAEPAGGPTWTALSAAARENQVVLIAGSFPEIDAQGHVYNACFIFNAGGEQIGRHRKVHLFDIDVPGGQRFRESETLTPGDSWTVVDTEFGKLGVSVCYDLRFPELARQMVLAGARIFIVPGAFNMTTGPAHWEILFRTRALDNQVYTLGCAPARDASASYVSYANSIAVDPWGEIIARMGSEEGLLLVDLDLDKIEQVRAALPLLKQRRTDLYG